MAQLRNDPDVQDALEATLKNGDSRHYAAALKVIVDYDDDLPANKLTPELRAELLAELRAEIAARKAAK